MKHEALLRGTLIRRKVGKATSQGIFSPRTEKDIENAGGSKIA